MADEEATVAAARTPAGVCCRPVLDEAARAGVRADGLVECADVECADVECADVDRV